MVVAPTLMRRRVHAVWVQPDFELQCLMCGSTVAEVFGRRVRHHEHCPRDLSWQNGRPVCCHCGGPVVLEQPAAIYGAGEQPLKAS